MGKIVLESLKASPDAARVMANAIVWDNHGCMPLRPGDEAFLGQLERYRNAGVDVVSINVGFDVMPWGNTVSMLALFRAWVRRHSEDYALAGSVADIELIREQGKLAVLFDIEGGSALNGQLSMVELYYELGVRWMLIAYNKNNALGGGCQDEDTGLTPFGRAVLNEMARVGMVICCSHTGFRTSMQVMEGASSPVIYSHSNPSGVWRHKRNICDQAIDACAATGGVIGINGLGVFLGEYDGDADSRTETIVRHIDYVVQRVGVDHVGLALDYEFDLSDHYEFLAANPEMYPLDDYPRRPPRMVEPEQVPDITERLLGLGYSAADATKILGGNHVRIARQVWK